MKHLLTTLLTMLLAFAAAATAQSDGADTDIAGVYTIQTADGEPVEDGAVWEITIVPVPGWPHLHVGIITRNEIEPEGTPDTGRQVVQEEGCMFVDIGDGAYLWENNRGTLGVTTPSPDGDGDLDSEVLTGPNAGTLRHYDKQPPSDESDD